MCCGSWDHKESDTTERLNWIELKHNMLTSWSILWIIWVYCPHSWKETLRFGILYTFSLKIHPMVQIEGSTYICQWMFTLLPLQAPQCFQGLELCLWQPHWEEPHLSGITEGFLSVYACLPGHVPRLFGTGPGAAAYGWDGVRDRMRRAGCGMGGTGNLAAEGLGLQTSGGIRTGMKGLR